MSKKRFDKRLERLFSEPTPLYNSRLSSKDLSLPGWTWECDSQGKFIACSPEIERVLGYRPESVIGEYLSNFGLPPNSATALKSTLTKGEFPLHLEVQYRTRDGVLLPISLHIFEIAGDHGTRWGGFAQAKVVSRRNRFSDPKESPGSRQNTVLDAWREDHDQTFNLGISNTQSVTEGEKKNGRDKKSENPASKQPPTQPDIPRHTIASQKIKSILENLCQDSTVIKDFEFSQVVSGQKEELREDRSKKPRIIGKLAGKEIHSYPKILIHEIEHRLEWGHKLDLTPEEADYLVSHKYRPSGLAGFLQRRSAPREILKQDKFWISVHLVVETGKSRRIWVNNADQSNENILIDMDDFLQDPKIIIPQLVEALDAPHHAQNALRIDEDYFISR